MMPDFFGHLLSRISFHHLNVLFLLGLALFGGTIGGRIFQKLKIPRVVGYIAIGILIGQSGIKIVDIQTLSALRPFHYFALGIIGFMIGGELNKDVIGKHGKQFLYILVSEGVFAFIAVSLFVGIAGTFLLGDAAIAWALALLLGAIASATAPAATTDVLWENRTRGPLTRTVLGIIAMDDALALLLFALASTISAALLPGFAVSHAHKSILFTVIYPIYEIAGSILVGAVSGFVLSKLLRIYKEQDRVLAFGIGTVLLVLGISIAINVDMILAAMFLGVTVVNLTPRKSKDVFQLIERFAPPIYVLFFVLVGAKLNIGQMNIAIIAIGLIYIFARALGKMFGSTFGARISNSPKTVQKYLPLCLFSQAGVAIGLSLLVDQRFPGKIGDATVIVITAATFVLEIIGPSFVKTAVSKAGEVGLDVTEEDIINRSKTEDMMEKDIPIIYENMSLNDILQLLSRSDSLYYPVADSDKKLIGVITIDNIRDTFAVSELGDILLAHDLMEPVIANSNPDTPIAEAKETMGIYGVDYLPVVSKENRIMGMLESRSLNRRISQRMIELEKKVSSLDG